MYDVRAISGESFDLALATTPSISGATVELTGLFGTGGTDAGYDEDGEALSFPAAMAEVGSSGSYYISVRLDDEGPYWATFTVDGVEAGPVIIRVVSSEFTADEAQEDSPYTLAVIAPSDPASILVTMRDRSGASFGNDEDGEAYTWPQPMVQVPGHTDAWYFSPVTFSEGGKVFIAVAPIVGTIQNFVLTVDALATSGTLLHFSGWEPDAGLVPEQWVGIGYIRKWTGWTTGHISDEDLRAIRRVAIETFIDQTNMWVPGWDGTFHGLKGQGERLYLPVPIILPSHGGIEPTVSYTEDFGDQEEISSFDAVDLTWRVGGQHSRQPYLELFGGVWDPDFSVKINASWGLVDPRFAMSTKFQQVMVGLIRWHGLSFGKDADEARDQSTLNRISSEGSRDMRVSYDPRAVSDGLTGDRTIDRALLEFRVDPGPWVKRDGDAGVLSFPEAE